MFCYQCEQTTKGTGCDKMGVCGKDPQTAALQDLLLEVTKGVAQYAHHAAKGGLRSKQADLFVLHALFSTITNVNFDPQRLVGLLVKGGSIRDDVRKLYEQACADKGLADAALDGPCKLVLANTLDELVEQGEQVGVQAMKSKEGEDVTSLKQLITYGLKGSAAYMDHAQILKVWDDDSAAFFHEALCFLTESHSAEELTAMALRVGEMNLTVMELLDRANTDAYGHPEPTQALVTAKKGRCILVSGHDLKDLEELLKQTEGKGIHVYTHGEMLPALAYPGLKKYSHLVGNYGSAWQNQRTEFEAFPGAILMTTNCIQRPKEAYQARIFTTDLVAWPGVTHIDGYDFSPVINAALAAEGFTEDEEEKRIPIGFARNSVLGVADKVVDAVKAGAIKHFFLVGGCDGAKPGRNYFTDFTQATPKDSVILTLACGKYRFNKLDHGDIGGIPRLLDIGQCNDAYSAIQIAVALAKAFDTDVNGLPLSFIISWYEQKAVAILLTLLHLGVKDIRLGPSLPAFVSENVLKVLVENFNIMPTTTVEQDLAACLA